MVALCDPLQQRSWLDLWSSPAQAFPGCWLGFCSLSLAPLVVRVHLPVSTDLVNLNIPYEWAWHTLEDAQCVFCVDLIHIRLTRRCCSRVCIMKNGISLSGKKQIFVTSKCKGQDGCIGEWILQSHKVFKTLPWHQGRLNLVNPSFFLHVSLSIHSPIFHVNHRIKVLFIATNT